MSETAFLQLQMTDAKVIRKMCERLGVSCKLGVMDKYRFRESENPTVAEISLGVGVWDKISIQLDGSSAARYDSDYRHQIASKLLGRELSKEECTRRKDGTFLADELIGDELMARYNAAAAIVTAEERGLSWEEGLTADGYCWIKVSVPDKTQTLDVEGYNFG